jgi:hypothetical protein
MRKSSVEDQKAHLERAFSKKFIRSLDIGKKQFGFRAPRIRQMIEKHGAVMAACKILAKGTKPQSGLLALHDYKRLDLSIEALAVSRKYKALFSEELRRNAQQRLKTCRSKKNRGLAKANRRRA